MLDPDKRRAQHSRRMSKRMDSSTMIGSHIDRNSRPRHVAGYDPSNTPVEFGDRKRSQRAARGMVSNVAPKSSSYESDDAYTRRVSRRGYAEEIQHRKRVRFTILAAVVFMIALVVAVIVGLLTFFISSDTRLSLHDSDASSALVSASADEPFYIICSAELGTSTAPPAPSNTAYMLVRVDAGERKLSFVSIPNETYVTLEDGTKCLLYEAFSEHGDGAAIAALSQLIGIDIAHYVRTDADRLSSMVDLVGGVPVSVSEVIDDPAAGIVTLKAGDQILDGSTALVFLRSSNLSGGLTQQAAQRAMFSVNLAAKALSGEGIAFASYVSDLGGYIETDWNSADIIAVGDALSPMQDVTVYSVLMPGHYVESDGLTYYEIDSTVWQGMADNLNAGSAPDTLDEAVSAVVPSEVTVEVQNGCGVTGAAAQMAGVLTSLGYEVTKVGNTDDDGVVYPETLIVYHGEENEPAAQAILRDVNGNRVVNGGDFYAFDSEVLVIVGSDWVPIT